MANMAIGSTTFELNPSRMSVITPRRHSASVKTYSSVAFFSWGADIVGKVLYLNWDLMPFDQYEDLMGLLEDDTTIVFDPQDGESTTYNVEVTDLQGEYFVYLDTGHRKNVILELLVLSEVA